VGEDSICEIGGGGESRTGGWGVEGG
jgi:hypothetical protein